MSEQRPATFCSLKWAIHSVALVTLHIAPLEGHSSLACRPSHPSLRPPWCSTCSRAPRCFMCEDRVIVNARAHGALCRRSSAARSGRIWGSSSPTCCAHICTPRRRRSVRLDRVLLVHRRSPRRAFDSVAVGWPPLLLLDGYHWLAVPDDGVQLWLDVYATHGFTPRFHPPYLAIPDTAACSASQTDSLQLPLRLCALYV